MSRVPLVAAATDDPVVAEVFRHFEEEGREPIALYRALAHAPTLLRAYSGLATALRYETQTPRRLRELAILRIAQRTGSQYEWSHHLPMARAAGVQEAQIAALGEWQASDAYEWRASDAYEWQASDAYDARERALLRCADELHECTLSDEAFAELERWFSQAEIVELLLLVAFYEAVARLIAGLGLEVEPEYESHP